MNIDVQFHGIELKADYKKTRITPGTTEFSALIEDLVQVPFHKFGKRGTGTAQRFTQEFTYCNLIDLEFATRKEVETELDRIVFHGEYFTPNDLNPARILTQLGRFNLYPQRIDIKFDVSADFISYDVIHDHFKDSLLTATSSCNQWASPEGAKTWYAGVKRPQGFRISFYEAAKIHTGLPVGAHRVELQMFGADAQKFAALYLETPTDEFLTKYILYMLAKRINFREPNADTNRARWPISKWWQDITEGAGNFSEHTTVTRKVLDANRIKHQYERLTASFDKLGLDLSAKSLGKFLLDKRHVLNEVFNLYPELDPSLVF